MDRILPVILYLFILGFHKRVYGNAEVDALNSLKSKLNDPKNVLQSWDSALPTPCTWFHVTCDPGNKVTRVDLGNADLSGPLVPELGQLKNLQYLELYSNNITGKIPDELGKLRQLVSLDLYLNQLEGGIPNTLGNLQKLRYLRLNNNGLMGTIPNSLTTIDKLEILDLSNNFLNGAVPYNGSFSRFTTISFFNNPNLTFANDTTPNVTLTPPSVRKDNTLAIAGGVAVGAAIFIAVPLIALAWWRRRHPQDHFSDVAAGEDPEVHQLGQLKRFSLRELQVATDDFSDKNILGKGGELQFQTEVELISMAVHRNLLRLQGFCMTPTERLLVYPFMVNGSVASCLKDRPDTKPALDWPTRKRIALGSARGLAYLHDDCDPKIIHRDVKAANILLDEEFEAIVGDFGLAKLMDYKDTHVTTGVRGTIGHIAPEYISTGRSSEKTDVFGYGVMLLELITGQRAYDLARLANDDEVMLLDWVKGLLEDRKLEVLVDPDLGGDLLNGVEEVIRVALLCTRATPWERPKMFEVVKMLEGDDGLAERWEEWKKEAIPKKEDSQIQQIRVEFDSGFNPSNDHLSGPR
ncbi:unnamed protein product [Lactuca saligna]|uniref:Protein kinase domain-containing protein n=1 Tax=Lactuca saligna TaxID=75948 RepID=A0AA36EQ31_LACSI|nr:unnamed protein product [Lactuca saligna]